ncbi:amino acid ABC transporter permease [Bordetella avium]|uniref:Amino acid ABC transporter, permease protein n=1 Tax=Bordetella avium (strain 197N) TaxID=360910 RepID=Q2KXD9_BORA1|nr:amino acid ABC transporter permease [Bordetella avium]AZY48226.1 amino acid ABC transporter permease [Bordetella avium]AZY51609.1 amino acid ABC transporter permease [Bordetella avium]RIQ16517.1 amino acid ABC transporter permease [Bordetella avium]RIQ31275.1 amino acid ABC transporter permease [Bordetella avium]RIQ48971.1 amino acid ABC transporter permease [Bordetella avium]
MDSLHAFIFTFFNMKVAVEYAPALGMGALLTLGTGLAVVLAGTLLGVLLAILRALEVRPLSLAIVMFADVLRSLPPLVLLIVLYFGLPEVGLPLSAFLVTWISLSLVLAAYAEESVWAGIASLPPGQMEAARSSGLSWWQAMRWVILPQAVRRAVPTLTNRIISITKNTALGSVVSLHELLNAAQGASSLSGNPTPLMMAAIAYVIIFLPLVVFSRWLEKNWVRC